jgi:hypothetical protein
MQPTRKIQARPAVRRSRPISCWRSTLLSNNSTLPEFNTRSGRDSIDHRPGAHDDTINSVAGALIQCTPVIEMTADMFAQSGGRSAGSFATGYGGYHTETFMDWTRTRDGGRTLWGQMPEEKKK